MAHLPAVGAVDVICRGQGVQGLFWGPALCSYHGGSQGGDALVGTLVG